MTWAKTMVLPVPVGWTMSVERAACHASKVRGLTGPERTTLYRLAVETGLRASELGSLTPASFDLTDLGQATVTVEAACSKHRREDVLPLRPDMARTMAEFIAGRQRDEVLFRMPDKPAAMLRKDLEAGGIPYRDASDRVADFHALRHTFITRLPELGTKAAAEESIRATGTDETNAAP